MFFYPKTNKLTWSVIPCILKAGQNLWTDEGKVQNYPDALVGKLSSKFDTGPNTVSWKL
jgi:hypothetical protein